MISEKILKLTKQLYPNGRAFKMPKDGILEKVHKALNASETQAYEDAISILNSILPDNLGFTEQDATDWEKRLGMITNTSVSLADRKLAIKRKLNHPGNIPARQHYLYLQGQLQAAGFDVYVHENIPEQSPLDIMNSVNNYAVGQMGDGQFGDFQFGDILDIYSDLIVLVARSDFQFGDGQMGDFQLGVKDIGGYEFKNKVANSIYNDIYFRVLPTYTSTFFIGGEIKGAFTTVDTNREKEFRQLILRTKPAQTIAYLLINYI